MGAQVHKNRLKDHITDAYFRVTAAKPDDVNWTTPKQLVLESQGDDVEDQERESASIHSCLSNSSS
jgi:hypothetical protein